MSDKKYIDLGQVTAYAYAVEHGYTGTEEEFGEEQAQFAQNAQQVAEDRVVVREDRVIVREDREHVDEVAEAFTGTTAPEAVQRVTTEGNTQVARVQDEGDTQVDRVQDEGDTQVTAVRGEGNTQVSRVQGEGNTQVAEVQDEGNAQVTRVQNEGATQVQAVEDKGEEILESIPENYEEKIDEVNDYLTNVIKVSDVQPQSEVNKLWIKDQVGQEYTVPTYEEFESLSNDVSNAKNAIDQIEEAVEIENFGVDLYNPDDPDVLRGQYYDGDILKTAAALGQSGYIPVEVSHYYTSNQRDVFVQLYDSEKTFVQKITSDDFARLGYVVIPTGIAYARFIFLTASENTFKIWETNASGADSPTVPYLKPEDIGEVGKNLRFIAGAIRKASAEGSWEILNDSGHTPVNLATITNTSGGDLEVTYGFTAKQIISFVVGCDETFANRYVAGASVGLDKATITIYSLETRQKVGASTVYAYNGNFWIFGVMVA